MRYFYKKKQKREKYLDKKLSEDRFLFPLKLFNFFLKL